jgi:hypothetical protein
MSDLLDEYQDPFALPDDPGVGLDLEAYGEVAAQAFYDGIQNASNSTARSRQQQDMFIGVSTLGHCKQYALLMLKQTPFSDDRDKTAAFFGTIAGEAIEAQLQIDHPQWRTQVPLEMPLDQLTVPLEGELGVPGPCDILIPWEGSATVEQFNATLAEDYDGEPVYIQGIWDGKSKAELETIRKFGPNRQQIYQLHAYTKAAIRAGHLNPEHPIVIGDVFFDRSGRDVIPHGVFHLYSENVVTFINEWVNDVIYAQLTGTDAEKEMPRDWCANWCEYYSVCRAGDTDVEGLIEDPEVIEAATLYRQYTKEATEAEKKKDLLKPKLQGINGSTGTLLVRNTVIDGSDISYYRKPYTKIEVRDVPKSKPKPTARKKKAAAAE